MNKKDVFLEMMQCYLYAAKVRTDIKRHRKNPCFNKLASQTQTDVSIADAVKIKPSSFDVIDLLLSKKQLNQQTIAKHINKTPQAVSSIIDALKKQKIITVTPKALHNQNIIKLSAYGEKFAKSVEIYRTLIADEIFDNLTKEDLKLFSKILKKIYKKGE